MVGIIISCVDGFVLSALERRNLEYFVRYFDGTEDYMGGPCVGLGL